MAESTPAAPGGIFISYRREETAYPAGWLYDRLAEHYGRSHVFKDIDSLAPGDDYVDELTAAVAACDVLLAIIGTQWLTVMDAEGKRRLDNPADFLRLEIEAALARDVLVVPVLIGGAKMPQAEDLPATLARPRRDREVHPRLPPAGRGRDVGRSPACENRLEASCTTDQAGVVRLVFSVNGTVVVKASDADKPFTTGTVGLVVATDANQKAIEAEFDDFVVTPA